MDRSETLNLYHRYNTFKTKNLRRLSFTHDERYLNLQLYCRRTSQANMASKVALLFFFVLEHTKWSLAFAARRLGRKIQNVFCPIRSEYYFARPFATGPYSVCPQGLLFFFRICSSNFFPPVLTLSSAPLTAPGSPRMHNDQFPWLDRSIG